MDTILKNVYITEGTEVSIDHASLEESDQFTLKILDEYKQTVFTADAVTDIENNKIKYAFTGTEDTFIEACKNYYVFFEKDGVLYPDAADSVFVLGVLGFESHKNNIQKSLFVPGVVQILKF